MEPDKPKTKRKVGRPSIAEEFPDIIPVAIRLIESNGCAAQERRRTQTITSYGVTTKLVQFSFDNSLDIVATFALTSA